jgi:tight adherence protein C
MSDIALSESGLRAWLPTGAALDDLIAALAALAMLASLVAVWQALRPHTSFERRLAQIIERRASLRRSALAAHRQRKRLTTADWMHQAVARLNLLRSRHATEARAALARAGIRSQEATIAYLFAQVSLPPLFGFAVLFDAHVLHVMPEGSLFRFFAPIGGVVLGFYAPRIYLKNAADKRAKKLRLALPDGLDLMVICTEAGLSLDAALTRVSRELEGAWPELAEELALTAAELTFLPDRRQAFDNLNNRTNSEGIRAVVNALQQTAKFGTPLADSLRVLATELRTLRMTAAEEKAARLPALLTVPMMLFILPTLFIVLLGPAVISALDAFAHR